MKLKGLNLTVIGMGVFALIMMSGCAQTAPNLSGSHNVTDSNEIGGETVTVDEGSSGGGAGTDSSTYNSSSDGFQSIYFGFGDYSISSDMQNRINANTSVAGSKGNAKIKIEGNCDEFGTDEYNYALGLKRAKAVKDGLAAQGVESGRMVIVSFGESNPVCNNPTDTCYAKNRRVDLRLAK